MTGLDVEGFGEGNGKEDERRKLKGKLFGGVSD
jgi:hypothetical protein